MAKPRVQDLKWMLQCLASHYSNTTHVLPGLSTSSVLYPYCHTEAAIFSVQTFIQSMEVLVQSWGTGPSVAIYTIAKVISPAAVQLRLLHSLCCVYPVFHVSHVKPVLRSPHAPFLLSHNCFYSLLAFCQCVSLVKFIGLVSYITVSCPGSAVVPSPARAQQTAHPSADSCTHHWFWSMDYPLVLIPLWYCIAMIFARH